MGKRRKGRKLAMQLLYQGDMLSDLNEEIVQRFFNEGDLDSESLIWSKELSLNAWKYLSELDNYIQKYSIGWDLNRFSRVDKSILRLAFYELLYTDTFPQIVIDEALELSKQFSAEDAPKFINGILGAYVKDVAEAKQPK